MKSMKRYDSQEKELETNEKVVYPLVYPISESRKDKA